MVDKSEFLRVRAFADLPDDQIAWFLSQAQETHIKAGDTYVRQGDPADWMFVILEGQFQWRGEVSGENIVCFVQHRDAPPGGAPSRRKECILRSAAVVRSP